MSDYASDFSEEKNKLSKEGQELKKLITSGHRKREAHTPNYDPTLIKKPNLARWTGKIEIQSKLKNLDTTVLCKFSMQFCHSSI